MCVTLSPNGSNLTVIRFAGFRLTARNCFPMAETTPPDLLIVPLYGIDIFSFWKIRNSGNQLCHRQVIDTFPDQLWDSLFGFNVTYT